MTNKAVWISVFAVVLSFAGGFLLANILNRAELNTLRSENERFKAAPPESAKNQSELSLTNDEIQKKIAEADRNSRDFDFQKKLGLALYRYASMKQDEKLRLESIRILRRALSLNVADYDIQVGLGNAYFEIGYFNKDNEGFKTSRSFYAKALEKKPDDIEVRTDLGITYFLQEPPDLDLAIAEFEKSLRVDPKHEKTIQFLIQALVKQNESAEAAKYLRQLKEANPNNPSLAELSTLVAQSGPAVEK